MIVKDVEAAVRALGKCFLDRLFGALRPHRNGHNFSAMFFLQTKGLFQRKTIWLIGFKSDIRFANPGPSFDDRERSILGGHLLDAYADFQMSLRKSARSGCSGNEQRILLSAPAAEEKRCVRTAEPEGIRQRVCDFSLASLVRNVIEIAGRIGNLIIQ